MMKFSNSSVINIPLNNSKDYFFLTSIVYSFTLWVIYQSGIYWLIKILFIALLAHQYYKVWQNPRPLSSIHAITLKQETWILHDSLKGNLEYTSVKRLIDVGMFQLLQFQQTDKKRLLIVFGDQMQKADNDFLRRRLC